MFPSVLRGFSVARLPLDSKTMKRPSPLMLPANDSLPEFVNCPITVSACEKALPQSEISMMAKIKNLDPKVTRYPPENLRKVKNSALPVKRIGDTQQNTIF